jgi:AcrR family transcriptional regulator
MSPKIVDKQKRKREILTAAFEQFLEKGYHKTTLGDIARAAGMGQGTLYYYFPAKDQIFWGVYEQLMSDLEEWTVAQINLYQTPQEQLSVMLRMMLQSFPEIGLFDEPTDEQAPMSSAMVGFSQVFMEFWLQAERSDKREEFHQRIARQQRAMIGRLQDLLETVGVPQVFGLDSSSMAHMLVALRDGLSFQLRMGTVEEPKQLLEGIRSALLHEFQQPTAPQATT